MLIGKNDFDDKWNFPNAVGVNDSKHVVMFLSARCGSEYYNEIGFAIKKSIKTYS